MWQDKAVCHGVDLEIFFPSGSGGASTKATKQAKQLCVQCPVTAECLDFAMGLEEDLPASYRFGVYGGRTGEQRARDATREGAA